MVSTYGGKYLRNEEKSREVWTPKYNIIHHVIRICSFISLIF